MIECRDRIQWILQYRASSETYSTAIWRGRAYCRSREALIRCGIAYSGPINPSAAAVLATLPEQIEAPGATATPQSPFLKSRIHRARDPRRNGRRVAHTGRRMIAI